MNDNFQDKKFRTLFLSVVTFGLSDFEGRNEGRSRHYSISLMEFNTLMETTAGAGQSCITAV